MFIKISYYHFYNIGNNRKRLYSRFLNILIR